MLHEFAVDPNCFNNVDALRRVTDHCGWHLGRFVSDFPRRRWFIEVSNRLKPNTFRDQHQLTETLTALQRRGGIFDTGRRYDHHKAWLNNALTEHQTRAFRAIIATEDDPAQDRLISFNNLLPETDHWKVETEVRIPRTAAALTASILPLILRSKEIVFVDPHFTPDTARFRNAIRSYLESACSGGRAFSRLELHTSVQVKKGTTAENRQNWIDTFCETVRKCLPRHIPSKTVLTVVLWDEKPDGDEMHGRYVLTEVGGIRIDKGLDLGETGQTTDVSLLAPNVHRTRLNDLNRSSQTYRFVDAIVLDGRRRL